MVRDKMLTSKVVKYPFVRNGKIWFDFDGRAIVI